MACGKRGWAKAKVKEYKSKGCQTPRFSNRGGKKRSGWHPGTVTRKRFWSFRENSVSRAGKRD